MKKKISKLYRLSGCTGCTKKCPFNGKVTTCDNNSSSKYSCNNSL